MLALEQTLTMAPPARSHSPPISRDFMNGSTARISRSGAPMLTARTRSYSSSEKVSAAPKLSMMPALLIRTSILGLGEESAGDVGIHTLCTEGRCHVVPTISWPHDQRMDGEMKGGEKEGCDNRVTRRTEETDSL